MGKVSDPIAKRIRAKAAKDIKGGFFGKITHYIPGWHGYQEKNENTFSLSAIHNLSIGYGILNKQDQFTNV